jgi:hypothetical protein
MKRLDPGGGHGMVACCSTGGIIANLDLIYPIQYNQGTVSKSGKEARKI